MKKIISLAAVALILANARSYAQKKPFAAPASVTIIGSGFLIPSKDMHDRSMLKKGWDVRAGHYQSITRSAKFGRSGSYRMGVAARIQYIKFPKDLHAPAQFENLRYSDGSTRPVSIHLQLVTDKKKPDAFLYLIGPAALFSWNKFFMIPQFQAGYSSVSQEYFIYRDSIRSVSDPSQNAEINFYRSNHATNLGFALSPGLQFGWRITKNFAAVLSGDYVFGPKHHFTDFVLVPSGAPASGVYDFQQIKNGTVVETTRTSQLRALNLSLNLGLTF